MKAAAIAIVFTVLAGVAFCALSGEGRIVSDTAISLAASPSGDAVKQLPEGTEVVVRRCIDTKHYIAPEIVDPEGNAWFIVDGRFHFVGDRRPWGC